MKLVILDRATLGEDVPLDMLYALGELTVYDVTPRESLFERISDADVLIFNKVKMDREAMDHAKQLKLICVTATGYDNVDITAASEKGIAVTNVPGYSTDSVVLFTLSTALALVSHLRTYNDFVKDGSYTHSGVANKISPVYHEIRGMTWGIIGYGNIGRAVAKVAEAMGARVIVNKRVPDPDAECVSLETLLRESDIITVHCPLNDETRGLIGESEIKLMKKTAILVNEARGAVLDSKAVASAIKEGRIGGFGTDVYEIEPMPSNHPFVDIMRHPNVLLTPHAAWGAYESRKRCLEIVSENISAFILGEIKNRVDISRQ